jgi:hypothetical protein
MYLDRTEHYAVFFVADAWVYSRGKPRRERL